MNKFKVGDKVYRLEDRKEANVLWEVSSIKVMKKGDKEYYNYVLKAEGIGGKFLASNDNNGSTIAFVNFEEDLELYKTPHERLLELGWVIDKDDTNPATLEFYYKDNKVLIIDKALKVIKTLYGIDLQLAEILVDYLKELEEWLN